MSRFQKSIPIIFITLFVIIIISVLTAPLAMAANYTILPDCANPKIGAGRTGACTPCDMIQVFLNVGVLILGLVGALALFFMVYGGFKILISAGDSSKISAGKSLLINSLIGLLIVLFAYAFITLAVSLVSNQSFSFYQTQLKCAK